MKFIKFAAVAAFAAGLAACGQSPEAAIEKNCIRFEKDSDNKAQTKEMCSCLADNLKDNMSKDGLKKVATAFKKAKNNDDFENALKDAGVTDGQMMSVMGAAKSCAIENI